MTTIRSIITLGIFVIFALTTLSLACVNFVSAETASTWTQPGSIDKTLLEQNVTSSISDKFCNISTENKLSYKLVNGAMKLDGTAPVENICWTTTSYGLYGTGQSGSYMRIGSIGAVTALEDNRYYLAVPNSSKLIMIYNNGTSFFQGVTIIENAKDAFILQQNGLSDKYVLNTNTSGLFYPLRDPTTNQLLNIGAVGTSANGQWLAIETSGSFLRYNLETKQFLAFEKPLVLYGYGLNPHYELAISDDGRYAIIGGGSYGSGITNVYDLATCVPVANQPLASATGCGKRNLKTDAFPLLTGGQAPIRYIFSGASSEYITLDVPENNQTNRYVISTPGGNQHLLEYLALGDSFSSGEGDGNGGQYYVTGTD